MSRTPIPLRPDPTAVREANMTTLTQLGQFGGEPGDLGIGVGEVSPRFGKIDLILSIPVIRHRCIPNSSNVHIRFTYGPATLETTCGNSLHLSTVNCVMDMITGAQEAAAALGLQIDILYASTGGDIETALAGVVQKQASALIITPGNLFIQRRVQIAVLAVRDSVPAIYVNRVFPEAGGLMSYGSDWTDTFRQAGIYCGRVLKGEKPADLPVLQQTKFHLVINLNTANALRLQIPPTLLALADEVIE